MAEEEKKEQEQGEEGESKPGKKKIIIIAIVAIVVIAIAAGVTLFLTGGDDSDGAEGAAEEEEVVEVKAPAIYLDLTPAFLITFNDGGRQRYMQIHVSVSSRDESSISAVEHHLPYIKSKINTLYSSQDFAVIQTPEGKSALREQSLAVINEVLAGEDEALIENVFFTNFVLQ